jgi:hypothetical protein
MKLITLDEVYDIYYKFKKGNYIGFKNFDIITKYFKISSNEVLKKLYEYSRGSS